MSIARKLLSLHHLSPVALAFFPPQLLLSLTPETQAPLSVSVGSCDPSVFSLSLASLCWVCWENRQPVVVPLAVPSTSTDLIGCCSFGDELGEGQPLALVSGLCGRGRQQGLSGRQGGPPLAITAPGVLTSLTAGAAGAHSPWAPQWLSPVCPPSCCEEFIRSERLLMPAFPRPVLGAQSECVCGWGGAVVSETLTPSSRKQPNEDQMAPMLSVDQWL